MTALNPHPPTGPYILIIDDETDIVDMLTELLGAEGWQTIGVKSAMAGWTFLKNVRLLPSLILLDLMLPDMDGKEFIIYQHADDELERIPVVIMSAAANQRQLRSGLEIVAFLPKPFDIPHLFELCATYCRRTLSTSGSRSDGTAVA